jgi:putative ABC transport system permease protein
MKAHDVVELAARNLRESVLRNSLTTVGIAVGVASLVAMLSLGVGLQAMATRRLARSGLFNSVLITTRDLERMGPRHRNEEAGGTPSRPLDEAARAQIAKVPHVIEVYPQIRFMAEVSFGDKQRFVSVAALPPSARDSEALENLQGSFFAAPKTDEVILQGDLARQLAGDPKTLLGKDVTLHYAERSGGAPAATGQTGGGNQIEELIASGFSVARRERKLRVVGIAENDPEGNFGPLGRARAFLPLATAEGLNVMLGADLREMTRSSYSGRAYMALTAKVDDPAHVQEVEDAIKKQGFNTFSLLDAARSLRRFFTILDLFLGIFGSLALAVALLGIVNTLIMAILERRREIGIMKAIGASDSDVRGLFFAEAGVMGFLGGLVGIGLGWAIGRAINAGANIYLRRQEMPAETFWMVPWWLVAGALAFSVIVSLVSGMYPASRAARLDPVQALRYE